MNLALSLVQDALADPTWDFRTVGGIANSTGLSEPAVRKVLVDHPEIYRLPLVPDRRQLELYTAVDKPLTKQEKRAWRRILITKAI